MSQWNNQISFKDITSEFDENKTIEKIKIAFKKDEEEKIKLFMKYLIYLKNEKTY